jgi:hypothetical protein
MARQMEYLIKQWYIAFSTEHRESIERSSIIWHQKEKEKEKRRSVVFVNNNDDYRSEAIF